MLLSLVTVPVVPNCLLSLPWSMSSLSLSMLFVSALITLLAVWTQVLAVSLTQHPTLVMMMRSTEICISLVTESIYWSHPPHLLSALGSIMVNIRQKFWKNFENDLSSVVGDVLHMYNGYS